MDFSFCVYMEGFCKFSHKLSYAIMLFLFFYFLLQILHDPYSFCLSLIFLFAFWFIIGIDWKFYRTV